MAPDSVWEIVFLMVILKIPVVYLCGIVYYAIKAEPKPGEGAPVTAELGPDEPGSDDRRLMRPRRPVPRPHGGPSRSYPRTARVALASSKLRRP